MTSPTTDRQLLREHVLQGSQEAFQALVLRHADLVFATAMRRLGNDAAAQEVAQDVFIILARKAARLQAEASLAGWLHRAAVLETRRWWRKELRRRQHEETGEVLNQSLCRRLRGNHRPDEGFLDPRELPGVLFQDGAPKTYP